MALFHWFAATLHQYASAHPLGQSGRLPYGRVTSDGVRTYQYDAENPRATTNKLVGHASSLSQSQLVSTLYPGMAMPGYAFGARNTPFTVPAGKARE